MFNTWMRETIILPYS